MDVDFARRLTRVGVGFKRAELAERQHAVRNFLKARWAFGIPVHWHWCKAGDTWPHLHLRSH